MKRYSWVLVLALALLCAATARAADPAPVGRIKTMVGSVAILRGAASVPASVGVVLLPGDRVVTGARSLAGITLADDTLLSAGPNSVLVIDDFRFDPTTHEGGLAATLLRGSVRVVSGLLAKRSPESVRIKTPTLVLGVRGTEFIIDTQGEGS